MTWRNGPDPAGPSRAPGGGIALATAPALQIFYSFSPLTQPFHWPFFTQPYGGVTAPEYPAVSRGFILLLENIETVRKSVCSAQIQTTDRPTRLRFLFSLEFQTESQMTGGEFRSNAKPFAFSSLLRSQARKGRFVLPAVVLEIGTQGVATLRIGATCGKDIPNRASPACLTADDDPRFRKRLEPRRGKVVPMHSYTSRAGGCA